jgi:micrococcal nuclease
VLVAALTIVGAVVVVILVALALGRDDDPASDVPGSTAVATNAVVERVVDGDTLELEIGGRHERVRLIGIDTPESVDPRRPVECFGPEAARHTAALVPPGTAVFVERDVEPRDDYGRLLVYLRRASDGLFVNIDLVEKGYAEPLRIEPNTLHAASIVAAARDAQRAGRGLWGACDG